MNRSIIKAKAYPPEKSLIEKQNNPASFYIYRPLSWPLTLIGLKYNLSPNLFTSLGLLSSITGLVFLTSGHFIIGSLCLNLAYIFDQVDGNVARATDKVNFQGAWFDSMVGFIYSSFSLLAFSLGLFNYNNAQYPVLGVIKFPFEIICLGGLGTSSIVIRKFAVLKASEHQLDKEKISLGREYAMKAGIYVIPKTINSFMIFGLLIASIINMQSEALVLFSAYQISLMVVVMFSTYWKLLENKQ